MPKGVYERTPEYRAIMAKAMTGRKVSKATRAKMSAALLGRNYSDKPAYSTIHTRHNRRWQRTGTCELCGQKRHTQWAWRHQMIRPGGYSDDRADYRELCRNCHNETDGRKRDPKTGRWLPLTSQP